MVMVIPGLVGVLLGIFLWLGGSLFARTSVGLTWLLLVAGVGIFFVQPWPSLGIGFMACMVAMVMKRVSTGLLTSVLIMFMVFLAACQVEGSWKKSEQVVTAVQSSRTIALPREGGTILGAPETYESLKGMLSDVCRAGFQVGRSVDLKHQVVVGISAFFALLIGCVAQRLAEVVSCATAGTILVWGGMVLMLLSKGAQPLTGLLARSGTYVAMMSAMIGVGALEQLLFCGRKTDKPKDGKAPPGKKGK
jgi:hypothetical protein